MIRRSAHYFGILIAVLLVAVTLFWFWLAVGVHLSGQTLLTAQVAIVIVALLAWALMGQGKLGWLLAIGLAGIAIAQVWLAYIPARGNLDWEPEVAHIITGDIDGSKVTLHNVRNFTWTKDGYTPRWETRVVDADQVTSVDIFTSVWDSPWIAHTMVSFGFADGQHIVFSSEIRRTKGQVYSTLGGFVREFELALIGADERDIIHLRTDIRGETVSLFPLTVAPEQRKALFLAFVEFGNQLQAKPEWYNTLTANCSTVPLWIARQLGDNLPLDWRIILSGKLQGYLHDRGLLRPEMTLEEIDRRARLPVFGPLPPDEASYSKAIRAAWATP